MHVLDNTMCLVSQVPTVRLRYVGDGCVEECTREWHVVGKLVALALGLGGPARGIAYLVQVSHSNMYYALRHEEMGSNKVHVTGRTAGIIFLMLIEVVSDEPCRGPVPNGATILQKIDLLL